MSIILQHQAGDKCFYSLSRSYRIVSIAKDGTEVDVDNLEKSGATDTKETSSLQDESELPWVITIVLVRLQKLDALVIHGAAMEDSHHSTGAAMIGSINRIKKCMEAAS
jgi:hypothetical protein